MYGHGDACTLRHGGPPFVAHALQSIMFEPPWFCAARLTLWTNQELIRSSPLWILAEGGKTGSGSFGLFWGGKGEGVPEGSWEGCPIVLTPSASSSWCHSTWLARSQGSWEPCYLIHCSHSKRSCWLENLRPNDLIKLRRLGTKQCGPLIPILKDLVDWKIFDQMIWSNSPSILIIQVG